MKSWDVSTWNGNKSKRRDSYAYQRVSIEVVVLGESSEKKRLLDPPTLWKSFVVTNRPAVGEDLFRQYPCRCKSINLFNVRHETVTTHQRLVQAFEHKHHF
jgi:hypothetical protein